MPKHPLIYSSIIQKAGQERDDSMKTFLIRFIQRESSRGHNDNPLGNILASRTCIYKPICRRAHKVVDYRFSVSAALTCRPMMLRPSLSFSGAKRRCCLSAYFTPMSYLEWKPLDLAWEREVAETEGKMVVIECILHSHIVFIMLVLFPHYSSSSCNTKQR